MGTRPLLQNGICRSGDRLIIAASPNALSAALESTDGVAAERRRNMLVVLQMHGVPVRRTIWEERRELSLVRPIPFLARKHSHRRRTV
jgi:hypothetical protein